MAGMGADWGSIGAAAAGTIGGYMASQGAKTSRRRARSDIWSAYNDAIGFMNPWLDFGATARERLDQFYESPDKFLEADPRFRYMMQSGMRNVQHQLQAGGKKFSGQGMKQFLQTNTDIVKSGAANIFGELMSMAGLGFQASEGAAGLAWGRGQALASTNTLASSTNSIGYGLLAGAQAYHGGQTMPGSSEQSVQVPSSGGGGGGGMPFGNMPNWGSGGSMFQGWGA